MLCSPLTREYLINYARPLIYTTFMSYPSLVAIRTVYDLMINGGTVAVCCPLAVFPPLLTPIQPAAHMWALVSHLHTRLLALSLPPSNRLLHIPQLCPESPIFSLLTPRPRDLARECQAAGFMVRAIVAPTVPVGGERVRVCLHAGNSFEEVDRLVGVVGEWVRKMGVDGVEKARL